MYSEIYKIRNEFKTKEYQRTQESVSLFRIKKIKFGEKG